MPIQEIDEIKFLALGDSYTIGQGINPSENWPSQLKDSLELLNCEVESLNIIARTGWTTSDLLGALVNEPRIQYDLVSLLIGVNNQFQSLPVETFKSELNELIELAEIFGNGLENVFVVSIPDYGVTPFGASNAENIARGIDCYNGILENVCDSLSIPFIDVTTISRTLSDTPDALAPDRLHPSAFQYALWVEQILPSVLDILEK